MKLFALLFLGVVIGWAASGVDWNREAVGQEQELFHADEVGPNRLTEATGPLREAVTQAQRQRGERRQRMETRPNSGLIGRYQASAYGWSGGHGCYIIDTMTGQTWHAAHERPATVVTESLNVQSPSHFVTPSPSSGLETFTPEAERPEGVTSPLPTIPE